MDWRVKSVILHETIVKKWPVWSDEDVRFISLALCGEVGEVSEILAGVAEIEDGESWVDRLAEELADVRIYLELLMGKYAVSADMSANRILPGPHQAGLILSARAGQLANLIKKDWRGDEGDRTEQIKDTLVMIQMALYSIVNGFAIDLDLTCEKKIDWLVKNRWPQVLSVIAAEEERLSKTATERRVV